jgi:hypothetical protein
VTEPRANAATKPKGNTLITNACDCRAGLSPEDIEDTEIEALISAQREKCDKSRAKYEELNNDDESPVCMVQLNCLGQYGLTQC